MNADALDRAVAEAVNLAVLALEERGVPVPTGSADRMDWIDSLHDALGALVDRLPVAVDA
jgi:hypothetical protein